MEHGETMHNARCTKSRFAAALLCACGLAHSAQAQLRVAAWNITNYAGTDARAPIFKTCLYASFQGRSFSPDIMIAQEIGNLTGANAFLGALNTAAGSPGDWAMAPFISGPDSNLVFYYRVAKIQFLGQTLILPGGNVNGAPRDIRRYDVRLVGYTSAGATVAMYGDHMKSGATQDDQDRRLVEATAIRTDSNTLPTGWQFLVGGDFNIQSSNQAAYQQLIGSQPNNRGRFFDPIATNGTWNNSNTFRFVHTQAPGGSDPQQTGGMDDRLDFILLGGGLVDGTGFEYIGNPLIAYSTVTWNDPNHSFRCWGNDGSSFNQILTITNNTMVGAVIAQALHDSTGNDGGHLPVYLDLRVPPEVSSPTLIDLGEVAYGKVIPADIQVTNSGDVARWNAAGIANLVYSFTGSPGLAAPLGTFTAAPGAPGNLHTIQISPNELGPFSRTLTINSNAPDEPARIVTVTGTVIVECYANCDGSTAAPVLNVNDFVCFLNRFGSGNTAANCDGSTIEPVLNVNDFTCFLNVYSVGCP
jgi:hypothetical protein